MSFSNLRKGYFKKIIFHINNSNVSVKEQFGLRKKSSITLAPYDLLNDTLSALNEKLLVGGVFCDLKKAFDCVNYILLSKVEFYDIRGTANKLTRSYLVER
jgi:hypothetical protein